MDDREGGPPEAIGFMLNWKVAPTGPMTARDRTRWEIAQARDRISRVREALDRGEEFTDSSENRLHAAFRHAVRAWCRTHLRCKDARTADDA